jgi:hypothetical protein
MVFLGISCCYLPRSGTLPIRIGETGDCTLARPFVNAEMTLDLLKETALSDIQGLHKRNPGISPSCNISHVETTQSGRPTDISSQEVGR